jgi:hypothetical protein
MTFQEKPSQYGVQACGRLECPNTFPDNCAVLGELNCYCTEHCRDLAEKGVTSGT